MIQGYRVLAVIPARGGSKGIPGKNIRPFLGKPLLAWTVEQALAAAFVDRVVVSTDDEAIARVAREAGADVPFRRPAALAEDDVPIAQAVAHAARWLHEHGQPYDIVVQLEATSPFRYPGDIDRAIQTLVTTPQAQSVVAVGPVTNDHPLWALKVQDGFLTKFCDTDAGNVNRQYLARAYLPYSIYVAWYEPLIQHRTFYLPRTAPYFLRREQKVDIDDEVDWFLAECLVRRYLLSQDAQPKTQNPSPKEGTR
ncbi:MAG: acylneuraminate cytidylyltransferase family protein [Chloroflexi bacterium]|nr:acylneuraminate cytidylyltransferase family protein [Chloroflexota bacterium]